MIITCNCGEKKFTLPDNSIPTTGRMVQCGFCGLKWKQFPVGEVEKTQSIARPKKVVPRSQPVQQKIQKSKKVKKTAPKKKLEKSVYTHPSIWQKNMVSKLVMLNLKKYLTKIKKIKFLLGFIIH